MPHPTIKGIEKSALVASLKKHFGFDRFRDKQAKVIEAVLRGDDVFFSLATGGGKSLVFQLPAMMLDQGLHLVISPLIALMADQVKNANARGIPSASVNSSMDPAEVRDIWRRVRAGAIRILYVSPEFLDTEGFHKELGDTKVIRMIVDEAHCVSFWGHDFRREYLQIPRARSLLGNPPLLMLSATAPVLVVNDVLQCLQVPNARRIVGKMDRPNLVIEVKHVGSDAERKQELWTMLQDARRHGHKTVVFCRRVVDLQELFEDTSHNGLRGYSTFYHGQCDSVLRRVNAAEYISGRKLIMFATSAFGMGVDIPDIRRVIHFGAPEALEQYWQEIGRGGRDGKRTRCTLLFQHRDVHMLRRFVTAVNPTLPFIRSTWEKLAERLVAQELIRQIPSRPFRENEFVRGQDDDAFLESLRAAALAQLIEFGVLECRANKLFFLIHPDKIRAHGLPITEEQLQVKHDASILRMQLMFFFAFSARRDEVPRRMIMDHLVHNSLVDRLPEFGRNGVWYELDEGVLRVIAGALTEQDVLTSQFPNYLRGENKLKGAFHSSLPSLRPKELKLDLAEAESQGYIRTQPLGSVSVYTLTPKGLALARETGDGANPIETFGSLRPILCGPVAKEIMRVSLEEWWPGSGQRDEEGWWQIIRQFLAHKFTVLDTQLIGRDLVDAFYRNKGRDAKRDREQARDLLNFLFDGVIEMAVSASED